MAAQLDILSTVDHTNLQNPEDRIEFVSIRGMAYLESQNSILSIDYYNKSVKQMNIQSHSTITLCQNAKSDRNLLNIRMLKYYKEKAILIEMKNRGNSLKAIYKFWLCLADMEGEDIKILDRIRITEETEWAGWMFADIIQYYRDNLLMCAAGMKILHEFRIVSSNNRAIRLKENNSYILPTGFLSMASCDSSNSRIILGLIDNSLRIFEIRGRQLSELSLLQISLLPFKLLSLPGNSLFLVHDTYNETLELIEMENISSNINLHLKGLVRISGDRKILVGGWTLVPKAIIRDPDCNLSEQLISLYNYNVEAIEIYDFNINSDL